MQDTVLVVPPYPYCIEEDSHAVDLEDCWTAWPQLFFSCHLRPKGGRMPKNGNHKIGPDDRRYDLVFFSTFEELTLPIKADSKGPWKMLGWSSKGPWKMLGWAWQATLGLPDN